MQTLSGVVERVTYFNPENGYSVIRLTVPGQPDPVTVVGALPEVTPGESLRLTGRWAVHPDYGRQFKAETCEQVLPATVEGIRRYLGSGLIKGIGPRTADKIVQAFGADTLYVIDTNPQRLREVPDIGRKRYEWITQAWEQQKAIKEVMVFLQSHGVSAGLAVKIYKQYGDDSLNVVKADPYRLARDIWGIGFKTADKIARALGLPADAPTRLEAGLAHTLNELADDGHVFAPQPELIRAAAELLDVPAETLPAALDRLEADGRIKREVLASPAAAAALTLAVYLTPFYQAEVNAAQRLLTLLDAPTTRLTEFANAARSTMPEWDWFFRQAAEKDSPVTLTEEQRAAVRTALTAKVSVLTGGPGTGKTTTLRALIRLLEVKGHPVALASPTGRAAKRLSEATGRPAQTLHRLLGFSPTAGAFTVNEHQRLSAHMVIVDEVSMLDLVMFNNLLKAIEPGAHLLLVGDADQLPSVGAGNVLGDLIACGRVPVVRLSAIFRQAAESHIITNAHHINQGRMPVFARDSRDFFLFTEDDAEQAAERLVDVVANRIPRRFGLNPLTDVQVLAPMHRGSAGVSVLNQRLQAALNPPAPHKAERLLAGRLFRVGDRVMQLRNNYQKETFNGDIGRIVDIDLEQQRLTAEFDGRPVFYEWVEADELQHAFAVSIHKAQGSEFPAVVVPLLTRHYVMLQRNLLYTAVTRPRQLCVLVGSRRAIALAVKNASVAQRWSGLAERLR